MSNNLVNELAPLWTGFADAQELAHYNAVAQKVAEELAPGALQRDESGEVPLEAMALLREHGLAKLVVPARFGGSGAHWETAFSVVRILGRADASIAQILGYHYLNSSCLGFYGQGRDQSRFFEKIVEQDQLWSDALNPVDPDLSLVDEGEHYRLNGLKRFATGAAATDVIISAAQAAGGEHDGKVVIFAFERTREGVEFQDDWDHLGQRASASGSVKFRDILITQEDVVGFDDQSPFSTIVTPGVQLLFGNIYLAAAEGALAQARELTLARKNSWFLSGVDTYAQDPLVHRTLGELVAKTQAVEALADKLNRRYDEVIGLGAAVTAEDRAQLELEIAGLKVVSTEVALEVTSRVYEATGASSTKRSIGLDVFWRNVRTHSLHDPVDYKKVEVGAYFLNGTVQPISLYT
ncbi:acyl-CoA dehydrogenase family protein [Glutamicibacter sp.]|uniref:acyl-CoA dehydrogenase family protein n=1 Tax=Glutamicibacter sp. TaxID=1931995 RepID=UPI0028BF0B07|nr:acyl-CoA dehydrogenase family protein [Glutamicibacter sp.]